MAGNPINEARYYEFINALPEHTVNKHGWVVAGIPFYDAGDAVRYTMKHTTANPRDHIIELNPAKARELAAVLYPEFDRLYQLFEDMEADARESLQHQATIRDGIEKKSIMGEIQWNLAQEEVFRRQGYFTALLDAADVIRKRRYELFQILRIDR